MQTNSPLGVRSRCLHGSGIAIQGFRIWAAVLACMATCLVNSPAPGQVESSPQLESLLGYERPDLNRPAIVASWKPQSLADHSSGSIPAPTTAATIRSEAWNSGEGILAVTPVSRMEPERRLEPEQSRDPLDQRLPGPSPATSRHEPNAAGTTPGLGQGAKSLMQTGVALAIVLALLFCFVWVFKRTAPKSLLPLPTEALQVLGNAPLHGKQHLRLIRLGHRVLLLTVSETTSQTLAEVTDPEEVKHLLELCQGTNVRAQAQTFEAVLREHGRERTKGFLGSQQDEVSQSIVARGTTRTGARQSVRETDNRSGTRPVSNHFFEA